MLNCEIGGLDCRVSATEYRTRVHFIHTCNAYFVMHWSTRFIREYLVIVLIQSILSIYIVSCDFVLFFSQDICSPKFNRLFIQYFVLKERLDIAKRLETSSSIGHKSDYVVEFIARAFMAWNLCFDWWETWIIGSETILEKNKCWTYYHKHLIFQITCRKLWPTFKCKSH